MSQTSKPNSRPIETSRAPGKIILAGEQFVVLGAPAVAMAVDLYSRVEARRSETGTIEVSADIPLHIVDDASKKSSVEENQGLLEPLRLATQATLEHLNEKDKSVQLNANCEIPIGAGLGSSASITVATISAVAKSRESRLEKSEIFKLAFVPERYLHGKPSGIDQATCAYGGIIQFRRPGRIKPLAVKRVPKILVCDSGVHRSTRTLVGSVVKRSRRETGRFRDHLEEVSAISNSIVKSLKDEDRDDLGSLMNRNHELLRQIGVSTPRLDKLVTAARRAGALGAKLTGAGGGGCIIALCGDAKTRLKVERALRKEGGTLYDVSVDPRGVV